MPSSIWENVYLIFWEKNKKNNWDVRNTEEQFLCDAQQTRPDGHNQQGQAGEHVEGEVQDSDPWRHNRKQEEQQAKYPLGRGGRAQ